MKRFLTTKWVLSVAVCCIGLCALGWEINTIEKNVNKIYAIDGIEEDTMWVTVIGSVKWKRIGEKPARFVGEISTGDTQDLFPDNGPLVIYPSYSSDTLILGEAHFIETRFGENILQKIGASTGVAFFQTDGKILFRYEKDGIVKDVYLLPYEKKIK